MHERPHRMPGPRGGLPCGGFTLIEVMTTVAIVAILAAIALPNYADYIKRSKIIQATTALSDARQKTEQLFLDTRTYVGNCAAAAAVAGGSVTAFTISCPASSVSTYTLQADGVGSMAGFQYQINETGAKTTSGTATGWAAPNPNTCWAIRKSGDCT